MMRPDYYVGIFTGWSGNGCSDLFIMVINKGFQALNKSQKKKINPINLNFVELT